MYLVGLTGGVATGKSTVSNMFRELGVPVIDADAMARRIVEPGRKAWRAIKEEFGPCVFHDNGELNRAALRTIIFEVCELFMSADVYIYFTRTYQPRRYILNVQCTQLLGTNTYKGNLYHT